MQTQTKIATGYIVAQTISEDDLAVLIAIRDNLRDNYFLVGDIANRYIANAAKAGFVITNQQIEDEIGGILGKSGRTIRYYAEEAAFYGADIRQQYDILPFSFFAYARSTDNWKAVLDYAMEHPGISLPALRALAFSHIANSELQIAADQKPDAHCGLALSILADLSARAILLVEQMVLPEAIKSKLLAAASTIRDLLADIDIAA
jgi:hypothetical protein